MHARVVRFTGVSPDRINESVKRVSESEGPPPGVDSSRIQLFADESQETAVVVVYFDDEEKMRAANEVFDQMDASETPGTRASVDLCELKLEREAE